MTTLWKMAVHLAVASDVFGGVFLCCPVSHEMFWMRSGTKLSRFLRIFSTYSLIQILHMHMYQQCLVWDC